MLVAGVLVLVVVLAGLAIWALRRRGADELHSVAGYQHRLERLEELRRRQLGTARPPEARDDHDDHVVVGARIPDLDRRPAGDPGRPPVVGQRHRPPPRGRRDLAIARMGHRPRRLGAPIAAAVAVVIVVTGLAIAGAHSHTPRSSPPTSARTGSGRGRAERTTTTTTAPRPTTFTAASTSGPRATYDLPFTTYSLSVSATADCYLQVTTASGQVPYASVLHAGQSAQLTLTGDSTVVLGAPSYAQVQVDRTPVTFPTPLPAPLDLVFNAAAAGSPSTTTSTSS